MPEDSLWLSPAEVRFFAELVTEKRRQDWLLGRHCLKDLIRTAILPETAQADISILPGDSGAPEVQVAGTELQVFVALSHSNSRAFAALSPWASIGCDLEWIEPRTERFIRDFFCADEAEYVLSLSARERALAANLIWSMKESVLKVGKTGLTKDTRSVHISVDSLRKDLLRTRKNTSDWYWRDWTATSSGGHLNGVWSTFAGFVFTIAAARAGRDDLHLISEATLAQ